MYLWKAFVDSEFSIKLTKNIKLYSVDYTWKRWMSYKSDISMMMHLRCTLDNVLSIEEIEIQKSDFSNIMFDHCAAAVSYERWAGCYLKAWEPVWAVY